MSMPRTPRVKQRLRDILALFVTRGAMRSAEVAEAIGHSRSATYAAIKHLESEKLVFATSNIAKIDRAHTAVQTWNLVPNSGALREYFLDTLDDKPKAKPTEYQFGPMPVPATILARTNFIGGRNLWTGQTQGTP